MSRRRIAVFGGTFNPPHLGHLIVAEAAYDQLDLDLVLWMPTWRSPDKIGNSSGVTAEHRVQMTHLATHKRIEFEVSTLEVERKGVSYTVDTLEALAQVYTDGQLFLLIGGDSYRNFDGWKKPDRIVELASLVVYDRPEFSETAVTHNFEAKRLESPLLDISSTDIRDRIAAGSSIRYLVDESVRSYIELNQLYKSEVR